LARTLTGDPGVAALLRTRSDWGAVVARQMAVFAAVEPGLGGQVNAAVVMSGIASAAGVDYGDVAEAVLRDELIAAGRRALGLRVPQSRGS
jgi:hypothetical protein